MRRSRSYGCRRFAVVPRRQEHLADVCAHFLGCAGCVEFVGAPGHREFRIPAAFAFQQLLPAIHTCGSLPFSTWRRDTHGVPPGRGVLWGRVHLVGTRVGLRWGGGLEHVGHGGGIRHAGTDDRSHGRGGILGGVSVDRGEAFLFGGFPSSLDHPRLFGHASSPVGRRSILLIPKARGPLSIAFEHPIPAIDAVSTCACDARHAMECICVCVLWPSGSSPLRIASPFEDRKDRRSFAIVPRSSRRRSCRHTSRVVQAWPWHGRRTRRVCTRLRVVRRWSEGRGRIENDAGTPPVDMERTEAARAAAMAKEKDATTPIPPTSHSEHGARAREPSAWRRWRTRWTTIGKPWARPPCSWAHRRSWEGQESRPCWRKHA